MIPMFKEKEEELTVKFEKLQVLKNELKSFKEVEGIKTKAKVQPFLTTSFMTRKIPETKKDAFMFKKRELSKDFHLNKLTTVKKNQIEKVENVQKPRQSLYETQEPKFVA